MAGLEVKLFEPPNKPLNQLTFFQPVGRGDEAVAAAAVHRANLHEVPTPTSTLDPPSCDEHLPLRSAQARAESPVFGCRPGIGQHARQALQGDPSP